MKAYCYDLESFNNCFTGLFVAITDTNKKVIEEYIKIDIEGKDTSEILTKLDYKLFVCYGDINDLSNMVQFLKRDLILIGFNNIKYDDIIVDFIVNNIYKLRGNVDIATKVIKNLSDDIISYEGYNYRRDNNITYWHKYTSIDLMQLHDLHKRKVGLKQVCIQLKYYKVEEYSMQDCTMDEYLKYYKDSDLTIEDIGNLKSFDRFVTDNHIDNIVNYNFNDVFATICLYYYSHNELTLRVKMGNKYNLKLLSSSRSNLGDKVMSKLYTNVTGLNYFEYYRKRTYRKTVKFKDIIHFNIKFETPELKQVLKELNNQIINTDIEIDNKDRYIKNFRFKSTNYTIATGGLHSIDLGCSFKSTKDLLIIEPDAKSYYPTSVIEYNISPKHLDGKAYKLICNTLKDDRFEALANNNKFEAKGLKITLNAATFGKLGYPYGWLYDPKAFYSVTINDQLYLIMLIEMLEIAKHKVISANTDGVFCLIANNKKSLKSFYNICKRWEQLTKFTLAYNKYDSYTRINVNSYLALLKSDINVDDCSIDELKDKGLLKQKNDFITDIVIDKGYDCPVVAIALNNYYIKDIPIMDTLQSHILRKDMDTHPIYDYCKSQKIGGSFQLEYHTLNNSRLDIDIIKLQKHTRFYMSNTGGTILKRKKENNKLTNIVKGYNITIFNNFFNTKDYNINYNYYKMRCYNIINKVNNAYTRDMKKNAGTLFD
jgi:hypothetical protein